MKKLMLKLGDLIPRTVTKEQCKDTGMAMVLLALIAVLFFKQSYGLQVALVLLLVDMILPKIFYPVAIVWFSLSNILGAVMSRVLLTLIYLAVVLPMGLLRKLMQKDSLQLKGWKQGSQSVFVNRDHSFSAADLEKPY
ncbi:hypothetical protein AAG747_09315 [Rapidithrix thailandica]|uniref:Uncharacterized protein n=1 Tax=Rapidithrix thailandica TaxID=413964 RepID=A0AAW9S574_9BACT